MTVQSSTWILLKNITSADVTSLRGNASLVVRFNIVAVTQNQTHWYQVSFFCTGWVLYCDVLTNAMIKLFFPEFVVLNAWRRVQC